MAELITSNIDTLITEIITLSPIIVGLYVVIIKIIEGIRCLLREAMLRIYYRCVDRKEIRQYEAEHFDKCYHAYKALKGNSFIDDIYDHKREWKVIK